MIESLTIAENAREEMKNQNKDIFWSDDLISVLFAGMDSDFEKFFPPPVNILHILKIRGPVSNHYYEIIAEGRSLKDSTLKTCTLPMAIPVRVNFSITEASSIMSLKPSDTETDQESQITLHRIQALVFRKNSIYVDVKNITYESTKYLIDIPITEHLFWTRAFLEEILFEITGKIKSDNIGGDISNHFPANTDKLELVNMKLNPRSNNRNNLSYIINVLPFKQISMDSEFVVFQQLDKNPISVVVSIPKRILSDAIAKHDGAAQFTVLPAIRIMDIYTLSKKELGVANFAAATMSKIFSDKPSINSELSKSQQLENQQSTCMLSPT